VNSIRSQPVTVQPTAADDRLTYYRILTRQGAGASGGAYDYLLKGKMKGGFALIAVPAEYGNSGIMSFMVNHDGTVFEKDLGPRPRRARRGSTPSRRIRSGRRSILRNNHRRRAEEQCCGS
jgi:hypothetical protein